ncbi:hypothetical protein HaLaN_24792, partial [Haematococcus lacustris]
CAQEERCAVEDGLQGRHWSPVPHHRPAQPPGL